MRALFTPRRVIGFNHPGDVVRHHSCRVGAMDEDPCRQAPHHRRQVESLGARAEAA